MTKYARGVYSKAQFRLITNIKVEKFNYSHETLYFSEKVYFILLLNSYYKNVKLYFKKNPLHGRTNNGQKFSLNIWLAKHTMEFIKRSIHNHFWTKNKILTFKKLEAENFNTQKKM